MTKRIGLLLLALAVSCLSTFAQGQKKEPSKPDTWQRSKECAAQAEKYIAKNDVRGGGLWTYWSNHYSPKYNRCFVLSKLRNLSGKDKDFYIDTLADAFEQSTLALAMSAGSCFIGGHRTDCDTAAEFIDEHMKN